MQVQSISGQNYSINKKECKSAVHPAFGMYMDIVELNKAAKHLESLDSNLDLVNSIAKVIKKARKKYRNLDQQISITPGSIVANFGDVFGESYEAFATRRPDDLSDTIKMITKKSKKIKKLENLVAKLKESKKINIEFEPNSIDSPDRALFSDINATGEHCKPGKDYVDIKDSIKNAAKGLSKAVDNDKYTLKLGFSASSPGVVKAKLVSNIDAKFSESFDLATRHNSKTINAAIDRLKDQTTAVDDPTWEYLRKHA